jgi:transcriptional regulator with PAS, ATPase and Fis domain
MAKEIHRRSPRKDSPFVVVNCGAIPENLMESEFFGFVKGAFTGANSTRGGFLQAAHEGTLFLDEIGEMPLQLQVKLLRSLQEKKVTKVGDTKEEEIDIRIVAATHRDLEKEINEKRFREDLYYRLNVINLELPPLRERGDDILLLATLIMKKYAAQYNSQVTGFAPKTIKAMRRYPWPGNVRELENRIKRAVVLCEKTMIGSDDLELPAAKLETLKSLNQAREEFSRTYVLEALALNQGNRTKTAKDLDVDPRTIFRYLERESRPSQD